MPKQRPPAGVRREPPGTVDEVFSLLRAQGGRATPTRRVLLETLFATDRHLTVEDLATAVQARLPDVHVSTIYRNVEELEKLGVVSHTHLGHGPVTYQLASHAHAHLICVRCGKRVEVKDDLFEDLASTARRELGFTIDPHHAAIFGRCSDCATP